MLCPHVQKTKKDYVAVMRKPAELMPSTSVCETVLDFARALWSAVQACIPEASLHGCWYHWAQAVYCKVKNGGLQNAYINQLPVRKFIRQLMTLPNLPSSHIQLSFRHITSQPLPDQWLKDLVTYYEKVWIRSEIHPPHSWRCYKHPVRTNNDAEGWHHAINRVAKTNSINTYLLISILHEESNRIPMIVKLVTQRKMYRYQPKHAIQKQATWPVDEIWRSLNNDFWIP